MTETSYSQRLQKRLENLKYVFSKVPDSEYQKLLCQLPSNTGRPEDHFEVTFYYLGSRLDELSSIGYQTPLKGAEIAILDAAIELYRQKAMKELPSVRELDFFLRDQNNRESSTRLDFQTPLWALEQLHKEISVKDIEKSYPLQQLGPFLQLSLQEKLSWADKALKRFLWQEKAPSEMLELIALDKELVIVKVKDTFDREKVLEAFQSFVEDFFQEDQLNVIEE